KIDENTTFESGDFRNTVPRFTPEARKRNLAFVELLRTVAARKGVTAAQLASRGFLRRSRGLCRFPARQSCIALRRTSEQRTLNSPLKICARSTPAHHNSQ